MARKSKYEKYRLDAWRSMMRGWKAKDLNEEYGIPHTTAHAWYKEFKAEQQRNQELGAITPSKGNNSESTTVDAEMVEENDGLVIDTETPSFVLAENTLRAIASNVRKFGGAVGVQASLGLLRCVQMRAEMPKHLLHGEDVETVQGELDEVREMGVDELSQAYRELLGQS
jgi:hypothetical protein